MWPVMGRTGAPSRALMVGMTITVVLSISSVSCDESPTEPFDTTPIVELEVSPDGASLSGVGSTVSLSATGERADGRPVSKPKITWASLNPAIATVDPNTGEVTAVASGQATISAEGNGATGFALITVSVPGLSSVREWTAEVGPTVPLNAVWVHSPTEVFAVGLAGTFIHYDGTTWETLPKTPGSLYGLAGTAPNNLYATHRPEEGPAAVVHFDGLGWTSVAEADWLEDIWAAPTGEVVAVGFNPPILRFDGTAWTPLVPESGMALRGVAGTSAADVYAVGTGKSPGVVWRFDGADWTELSTGFPNSLFNVWAASPSDILMTGFLSYQGVVHFDGVNWVEKTVPNKHCLGDLWGSSADNVFAVGVSGAVCRYDGSVWSEMESGTEAALRDVAGSSSTDVFAVGEGGIVMRYDGSSWTTVRESRGKGMRMMRLNAVWGPSAGNVLVVGLESFLEFDGSSWTDHSDQVRGPVFDLWGTSANDVFAVFEFGGILHFDGVEWSGMETGDGNFLAVWGASPADVWAVGLNGQVQHFDGDHWEGMQSPGDKTLRAVWGTSASDLIAAGDNGNVHRHRGGSWTKEETGTAESLYDIWGPSADEAFIVGAKGTILHFEGTGWTAMASGTDRDLGHVWGTSSTDVYASGHNTILHFDGVRWTPLPPPFPEEIEFQGIWGVSDTDVYVVGEYSTILRGVR